MEKVKLTKSQAEEIERIKKVGYPVMWKDDGWYIARGDKIKGLSFYQYITAINEGYEVEPEFKVGDWVVIKFEGKEWVTDLTAERGPGFFTDSSLPYEKQKLYSNSILRHATPQEKATENARRWWKKHGREVWELKKGDIIRKFVVNGAFYEVTNVDREYIGLFDIGRSRMETEEIDIVSGGYRVVCFADHRKDI